MLTIKNQAKDTERNEIEGTRIWLTTIRDQCTCHCIETVDQLFQQKSINIPHQIAKTQGYKDTKIQITTVEGR